ncbi:hypothetical protein EZS27_010081 [termite gut metagenome]|uniref:Outer membrane protein beta-barrel domain-containing protein n=1 Tax=termite gut metagenome TaxID=433724 RepID=A0A5J4S7P7_9ZZZZ
MKKLIIFLLLYCPVNAYTQGWSLDYSIGYGTYQLDNIKSIQYAMLTSYGLKNTDCFPDYITHSVALGFITGHHHFGSNFSYLTTGGRLHRADYSGSYTVDMIMNGYRLGAFYRYYINTGFSPLDIYLQLSPGAMFSNLNMKEQVNIYSESAHETMKLKGVGIYLEPTIGATYHLTNWLHFSMGGGYEADFLGTLNLSGQKTQIKAHWNGFRLYGGFVFILPTKKSTL